MTLAHGMDYHLCLTAGGTAMMASRGKNNKTDTFLETLGEKDIDINDFKVDDLRKIASKLDISGSHDMHKEELVDTINKTRRNPEPKDA